MKISTTIIIVVKFQDFRLDTSKWKNDSVLGTSNHMVVMMKITWPKFICLCGLFGGPHKHCSLSIHPSVSPSSCLSGAYDLVKSESQFDLLFGEHITLHVNNWGENLIYCSHSEQKCTSRFLCMWISLH